MNEYLNPDNYEYIESNSLLIPDNLIEIPIGAEFFVKSKREDNYFFAKNNEETLDTFGTMLNQRWHRESTLCLENIHENYLVLWKRKSKPKVVEDVVNQPSHYKKGGVECINAIESSMTKEAFCGYLKGNVQKYMWRYENKGGVESLKKAQWYLNKLIEVESK